VIPLIDIFRKDPSGLLWIEAVQTQEEAKIRVQELAASVPGEYLIFSQGTGNRLPVRESSSGVAGPGAPTS
jgi:hypothetical protein